MRSSDDGSFDTQLNSRVVKGDDKYGYRRGGRGENVKTVVQIFFVVGLIFVTVLVIGG